MKIFISHSSKNLNYGQAIVDLLVSVGVNSEDIIFTSNDAFGIPTGQNIFNWLKNRISEKPHVIYLLSTAYYTSIACLNEMGAAWVVENEHTMIFTPEFKTSSYEFQNGALDPREMGFYITNHDRMVAFIESLRDNFPISKHAVFVGQKIREFIQKVESLETPKSNIPLKEVKIKQDIKSSEDTVKSVIVTERQEKKIPISETNEKASNTSPITETKIIEGKSTHINKFFKDFVDGKLKDEEILLIHYAVDTARYKLGTGWQEQNEVENIRTWEDVNELNGKLSSNYSAVLRRFELKKLTEVTDTTSYGNAKEIGFTSEIREILLDLPSEVQTKIEEVLARNERVLWEPKSEQSDDLPF